ncbi:MAG: hypothetical protein QGG53_41965, partial [Planctomycetota bacterium]|nr:hypothetical protein [Planctomycetota bacterium]
MKTTTAICSTFLLLTRAEPLAAQDVSRVHMANGIKIGEVAATTAVVWIRLTENAERNVDGKPFPRNVNRERKSAHYED